MHVESIAPLSHKEFLQADRDYEKAAEAVHLLYVSDRQPGITRLKKGKGFSYRFGNLLVKEKAQLDRIRRLVIPPAWTEVWICSSEKGHIQATGLDARRRKQYRYHPRWNSLRNETKFHRLYEFGKSLPVLREKIEADSRGQGLTQEKVLATVVSLMERTYIRIGSNEYEKANGSYGLTTLKNKHVSITGDKLVFSFTGKKGIHHDITLKNKRLARTVSQCRDIPGKELFQYYAEDGTRKGIDSGMVNHYIQECVGMDFTAKDFRTWAGSLHALRAFRAIGEAANETECKKNLVSVLDTVSIQLGNTRTVCKKYYVHPGLIQLYEDNQLVKFLRELDAAETTAGSASASQDPASPEHPTASKTALTPEEEVLLKILRQYIRTTPINA
jgi:DNA topoisomerase-1